MRCWNTTGAWKLAISRLGGRQNAAGTLADRPRCRRALQWIENPQQQRPSRGFARRARSSHRDRHRALNLVHVEVAGSVAVSDPGLLHRSQLRVLLAIERADQALEIIIEQIVPDHPFQTIAVRGALIGGTFPRLGAWHGDKIEHTLLLALVDVILIFA